MKGYIKKLLFKLKIFNNNIFYKLNSKKFDKKVAIITCNKYKDKVKEDILLKIELNKKYIDCDIVSWEEFDNIYDAVIIRSVWGYQNNIKGFIKFLKDLKISNIKVFNDVDIMLSNLNKKEQFELLDKYDIPHIKTEFISKDNLNKFEYSDNMVIKPIISGGGNNTYIITNENIKNKIKTEEIAYKYKDVLNEVNNYLMIQPYVKETKNGELSVVYIDNKISHGVIRYTNTFSNNNLIRIIDLDCYKDAVIISDKVNNITEYKSLYKRVDLVKINNTYKVMEVELVDPDLFLEYRQNRKALKYFANVIKNRLN